jgi:hypothetical protein
MTGSYSCVGHNVRDQYIISTGYVRVSRGKMIIVIIPGLGLLHSLNFSLYRAYNGNERQYFSKY